MRKYKRRPDLYGGSPHNTSQRERRKTYKIKPTRLTEIKEN